MRQHLAHVFGQQAQQLILNGRQVQLPVIQIGAASGIVHPQITVDKHRPRGHHFRRHERKSALGDTDPGQQLLHGEGLRQVVICAGIQGVDLVPVFASGADDDDGSIRPGPDIPDDLHAVHIRQTQIQKDNVGVMGGRLQNRGFPVGGNQIPVIVGFQRCCNQVADRRIVLHNQNQRLIHTV